MKLYLGCSTPPFHPQHHVIMDALGDDWEYIDKFTAGEERGKKILNYDVEELPYEPNSIDVIYNSHLLEHIPFVRVPQVLKHWYSLLKPGGYLIINVPDLEWVCKYYLRLLQFERNDESFKFQNPHYHWTHNWELPGNSFIQMFYGSQQHDGEYHTSGYSDLSLRQILEITGYKNIEIEKIEEAHNMGVLFARCQK